MLHIIADIIVCDVRPCKVANEERGKLVRTHICTNLNKICKYPEVPLFEKNFVFWLKFYFRDAFLQVLMGRSTLRSMYQCFIKLVMKFVLFFLMKVDAVAYYMRQNRSHWCLSLGPNRHVWRAAHSSWAMSKQY